MGPEKVLEPWFQAVIKKKIQSKELEFFGQEAEVQSTISKSSGPEEEFLSELKSIETNLANLAISQRTSSSSVMGTKPWLALHYNEDIAKNEEKLIKLLGGREKMNSALDMIFSMDFHKTFMNELKSPSSSYYYDLAFLEPFRYLNYDIKAEEKNLIYQQLEIERRVDHILTIMHQAPIALENFKNYLKIILR
ncbi:hypothetical protein PCANC_03469 [Puccinia coronata f. sp. avenae]|nr:hypothetical protein PCANC_03469 [Puccinia coronata f. sp. avenae]